MTYLPGVFSQRTPEAGDLDECWVYATIWAAVAADPGARVPTVTEFRAAAGDPDDGVSDGGSLNEIERASAAIWPHLRRARVEGKGDLTWGILSNHLAQGRPASLAVDSGDLPLRLRFGFYGSHQIGVRRRDAAIYVANPLAKEGSAPLPATEAEVRAGAFGLLDSLRIVRALVFLPPAYGLAFTGGAFWTYTVVNGVITGRTSTDPFSGPTSAPCEAPRTFSWPAKGITKDLALVTAGALRGKYVAVPQPTVTLYDR